MLSPFGSGKLEHFLKKAEAEKKNNSQGFLIALVIV